MWNYLSIDLESWAMPNIPNFLILSSKEKKRLDAGHAKYSTLKILNILKKNNTKITFFIVGQIYEWYPKLVDMIASEGHEIAYHTHSHDAIGDKESFITSIEKSKKFIRRFKPVGFRAPRITIEHRFLQILKDYGFKYDSSTYGAYSDRRKIDGIIELPVTSMSGIPVGSGYFLGLLGKKTEWLYKKINQRGAPVISFLHNWQVLKPAKAIFPNKKYILTHPHYFPYLIDCSPSFSYLIAKFRFIPMKNLII